MVALLGTHETPLPRRFVAFSLWLDKEETRALANLRSTLWRLREELSEVVQADGYQIWLSPEISVDFIDARRDALNVIEGRSEAVNHTYVGNLLPGWYDEWVIAERESLRSLHLQALEKQAESSLEKGDISKSVDSAHAATTIDPLRESAHRLLIVALLAQGDNADAVRIYETYRARLVEELGMEPSYQLRRLIWGDQRVAL